MLLREAAHSQYEGWSDWQLSFLGSASQLANSADMRKEWEESASSMISRKEDSWSKNHFAESIAMMRYHIIREDENGERAAEFFQ